MTRLAPLLPLLTLTLSLLLGCATKPTCTVDDLPAKRDALTLMLTNMLGSDSDEARRIATAAVDTAWQLREPYGVKSRGWSHNFAVSFGFARRGLCYQWAEDLAYAMRDLHWRDYQLEWIIAHHGGFNEHNALAVTRPGEPIETGIVLDAWRDGGCLFFAPVSEDTNWPWQHKPGRIEKALRGERK